MVYVVLVRHGLLVPHHITLSMEEIALRRSVHVSTNTDSRIRDVKGSEAMGMVHISRPVRAFKPGICLCVRVQRHCERDIIVAHDVGEGDVIRSALGRQQQTKGSQRYEPFRGKVSTKGPIAPWNCIPAANVNLYTGFPESDTAAAM